MHRRPSKMLLFFCEAGHTKNDVRAVIDEGKTKLRKNRAAKTN